MDMMGRIRRLHSRDKKSEREIPRMTGLIGKPKIEIWIDFLGDHGRTLWLMFAS
jgi:hypothetical protein